MIQNTIDTWDFLIESEIATGEELKLVTSINGMNEDTLNDVIYVRTGTRDIGQLKEELGV